jgi:hypothetical protein
VKLTDTHYQKFSPRERIALFSDAMGRRDGAEADRLIDICPEKTYRIARKQADQRFRWAQFGVSPQILQRRAAAAPPLLALAARNA